MHLDNSRKAMGLTLREMDKCVVRYLIYIISNSFLGFFVEDAATLVIPRFNVELLIVWLCPTFLLKINSYAGF